MVLWAGRLIRLIVRRPHLQSNGVFGLGSQVSRAGEIICQSWTEARRMRHEVAKRPHCPASPGYRPLPPEEVVRAAGLGHFRAGGFGFNFGPDRWKFLIYSHVNFLVVGTRSCPKNLRDLIVLARYYFVTLKNNYRICLCRIFIAPSSPDYLLLPRRLISVWFALRGQNWFILPFSHFQCVANFFITTLLGWHIRFKTADSW